LLSEYKYQESAFPTSTEALRSFIVNTCADREVEVDVNADNWLLVFWYDANKWYLSSLHQSCVAIKRPRTQHDVDVTMCAERAIMFAKRFAGYGPEALKTDTHDETLSVATLVAAVCGIMLTSSTTRTAFSSSFNKLKSSFTNIATQSMIIAIANATGEDSSKKVCTTAKTDTNAMFTCWLENGCKTCKDAYVTFEVQSDVYLKKNQKQIQYMSENNLYRVTHSIYMWTFYGTKPLSLQSVEESTRTKMKNLLDNSLSKLSADQETLKRHTELLCEVLICLMCYAECDQQPLSDEAITAVYKLCNLPVVMSESKAQYQNVGQVPTTDTYSTHYDKKYCHTNQDKTLMYLDKDDYTKGLFLYCTHTTHTPNTLTQTHTHIHTHTHPGTYQELHTDLVFMHFYAKASVFFRPRQDARKKKHKQ